MTASRSTRANERISWRPVRSGGKVLFDHARDQVLAVVVVRSSLRAWWQVTVNGDLSEVFDAQARVDLFSGVIFQDAEDVAIDAAETMLQQVAIGAQRLQGQPVMGILEVPEDDC